MNESKCRTWYEGDPILEKYHDHEWCKVSHDDRFQFEMLCLEGASVGLSWKTIMHKREAYREAFHGFDIDDCAAMTDEELENVQEEFVVLEKQLELLDPKIIINRITSDPDKEMLIEPRWLCEKCQLLNDIDKEMKKRNTYQGAKL